MRTLKKSLSLVLVLAMVFSFCAMGTSAAFIDADEISAEYTPAVELLNTLGILKGDDNGFRPADTLTRAEAAVIIVKILGADKLAKTATCTFTDVEVGDWFYPWIGYCQGIGLMKGYGDGTVGPNDELTAHQFALMVMKAAKVDTSSVDPAAFELTVSALAVKEGFASIEELTAETFTREMAASVAYEGLRHDPAGIIYVVDDGVNEYCFDNANDAAIFDATVGPYGVTPIPSGTSLLADKFGISENLADKDVFGRPGISYNKTGWLAPIFFVDEPVLTYTNTAVSGGELYTDLGKPVVATISAPVNGAGYYFVDGVETSCGLTIASGNLASIGGKGSVVEVYKVGTTTYRIVVVNTYASNVTAHVDAVLDANGDITAKEYINIFGETTDFETTDFTILDALLGTVVYYTKANSVVQTVTAAESFEGTLTKYNTTTNTYTISGANYSVNAVVAPSITGLANTPTTYFVDASGLIIDAIPVAVDKDVAIVNKLVLVQPNTDGSIGSTDVDYMQAELIFFDGSKEVVPVSTLYKSTGTNTYSTYSVKASTDKIVEKDQTGAETNADVAFNTLDTQFLGYVVEFSVDAKGNYTLYVTTQDVTAGPSATISATAKFDGSNVANMNTKFIVRTGTDMPGDPYVYTAYTGYANLPAKALAASSATVTGIADVGGTISEYVYITASSVATAADATVVYVIGDDTVVYDAYGVDYYEYAAIIDGELTTIKVDPAVTGATASSMYGFYSIDATSISTGYVTAVTSGISTTLTTAAKNGIVEFGTGWKDYNGTETVYYVNEYTGAVTTVSIEALTTANTGAIYVTYVLDVLGAPTNVIATITAIAK